MTQRPYVDTPRGRPTFVRCLWCKRLSVELTGGESVCDDCGYSGYCAQCGEGFHPRDGVAPDACSPDCERELAEQRDADSRD